MLRSRTILAGVVALTLSALADAQPCVPGWSNDFPAGDVDNLVRCSLVTDLGDGPRLYIGGAFRRPGGIASPGVAAFDGRTFLPVGAGIPQAVTVYSLLARDEGGKPVLYAGGDFRDDQRQWGGVMRWDGAAWAQVGGDFSGIIRALTFFDDGTGPALYAAGLFDELGGQEPGGLARWNGTEWELVGGGLSEHGYALLTSAQI